MEPKYFEQGNYIYECKTSPSKMGDYFDNTYLKSAIKKLKDRWDNGKRPSGYRYVFPVNYLDTEGQKIINQLKEDYPGVDICYFDKNNVEKLISQLEKINQPSDLVEYIKQLRQEATEQEQREEYTEPQVRQEFTEKVSDSQSFWERLWDFFRG